MTTAADPSAKDRLRFLTCGSVDDGKSTLIGRLLFDSKLILEDQLEGLERESQGPGAPGEGLDLALLLDGLEAEREQGITIDVAYRLFSTSRRSFIVADTPGHEQYTRNMVTGASTSDAAVILVDARKGVLTQTRRHAYICSLLGIRHIALAVNKIDLVGFSRERFEAIAAEFGTFAATLEFTSVTNLPLSARFGDNVTTPSGRLPWYTGPTLLDWLETIDPGRTDSERPLRLPVQWVNRPDQHFRGYAGTVASGVLRAGAAVVVSASGQVSRVDRIVTADGDLAEAHAGAAVTVVLADEVDVGRGDVLASPDQRPEVADQFAAHLIWMSKEPLLPGRSYLMRVGTLFTPAQVTTLKHAVDVNTGQHVAARTLGLNEIGVCNISTGRPVAFDPYHENRDTGAFVLIDRLTHATAGAGLIQFGLRRATNIHWQSVTVDRSARATLKGHSAAVIWFTGLSGSGKSTIANLVERDLHSRGVHTYLLDGDNVRHGLNRDLGFTPADRVENIRRVGEVARLFVDAGIVVLCSFISPYRAERRMVRELLADGEFLEVYLDTPLAVCEARDPKGLYAKARAGAIKNFTGIDAPYEVPELPELRLETGRDVPEVCARAVVDELVRRGVV